MDREDIIKLAQDAGCKPFRSPEHWDDVQVFATPDVLERFAALVVAAEREKVAAWMIQRSYATGHGDTIEDLLKELDWQIAERIAAEREAILKLVRLYVNNQNLEEAIQARERNPMPLFDDWPGGFK